MCSERTKKLHQLKASSSCLTIATLCHQRPSNSSARTSEDSFFKVESFTNVSYFLHSLADDGDGYQDLFDLLLKLLDDEQQLR